MTQSSIGFIPYRPHPSNKKIALADGHFITVVGKGDMMINQNLILKDVLHMFKLSANLISVHKLIMNLLCFMFFTPTSCQFLDQGAGKVIGLAKEDSGLYHREDA